jgi:hypothetical protein
MPWKLSLLGLLALFEVLQIAWIIYIHKQEQ